MNGVAHTLARVTPSLPSVSHLSTISIFSYQKKKLGIVFCKRLDILVAREREKNYIRNN